MTDMRLERANEVIAELRAEVARLSRRPPMACYTCEQHNEQLVELLEMADPLLEVVDDEFMRSVAGYGYNTARIHKSHLAYRARLVHLAKHKPEVSALLGRIVAENRYEDGNDPICGACQPEEFEKAGEDFHSETVVAAPDDAGHPAVTPWPGASPNKANRDDGPWYNQVLGRPVPLDVGVDPAAEGEDRSLRFTVDQDNKILKVEDVKTGLPFQLEGRRGVDFPCEDCDMREGSTLVDGWYRCNNCGYPRK